MTNLSEIEELPDGTYIIREDGTVENYGDKWSYGYVVGLRPLTAEDLEAHRLFGVWHDEVGIPYFDVVEHVADLANAMKLGYAMQQKAIYDLRSREVIDL